MTRREFDALTKVNYGGPTGRRSAYRSERGHVQARDYVADRAAYMMRRNSDGRALQSDGYLPTLGIGSPFRAPQALRAQQRLPLLSRQAR